MGSEKSTEAKRVPRVETAGQEEAGRGSERMRPQSAMDSPTRFRLPDGYDQAQIGAALAKRYIIRAEATLTGSWTIYDTFDWRLSGKSLTLQWSGGDLVLRSLPDGEVLQGCPLASPPGFAWDLPEGPLREQVSSIIEVRRLIELVTAHTWSSTFRVLNKDEKTVARLARDEVRPTASEEGPPFESYLTVLPLRGYGTQARRISAILGKNLIVASRKEAVFYSAFRAFGQKANTYSGKLRIRLKPKLPAGEATGIILRQLLEIMRANEPGIKADLDIEYLHDYRIAVRKSRSALSQLQGVFPESKTEHYKRKLGALGRLTNDLRDLDVFLLAEAYYRAILPPAMKDDITPLVDHLRALRAKALFSVTEGLEAKGYARILEDWQGFLHKPATAKSAVEAKVPVIDLARKRIYRRYCRIVRSGMEVLNHTEDELLHDLRIECKKLRYLLEFFASLFPPKKLNRITRQLKRLQNCLGEFTDLSVQQHYLLSIAEGLDLEERQARRVLVATGFLVETMARKQKETKARFAGIFSEFASPAHQKQCQLLFARRKGDES